MSASFKSMRLTVTSSPGEPKPAEAMLLRGARSLMRSAPTAAPSGTVSRLIIGVVSFQRVPGIASGFFPDVRRKRRLVPLKQFCDPVGDPCRLFGRHGVGCLQQSGVAALQDGFFAEIVLERERPAELADAVCQFIAGVEAGLDELA